MTAPKDPNAGAWRLPARLIALWTVPVGAALWRLWTLLFSAELNSNDAHFLLMPLPVGLHLTSAALFAVLGAAQFSDELRQQRPGWYRLTGWLVLPCGVLAAGSGLWMTLYYPLPPGDGGLLTWFRQLSGSTLLVLLLVATVALWRRDLGSHGAWMARAYAVGMGAGTQAVLLAPWLLLGLNTPPLSRGLLLVFGTGLNVVVAELHILRRLRPAAELPSRRRPLATRVSTIKTVAP